MELTVGILKKVMENLDDDTVLACLDFFNKSFKPYTGIKRLLILKDETVDKQWGGKTFLTINNQGSHFTGEGDQRHLTYQNIYFDEDTISNK